MARGYSDLIDEDHKGIIQTVEECLKAADEATADDREAAKDDLEFLIPGNQWPADVKADRTSAGRPCPEVDVLNPYINQVVNEQRENRPAPQVNPTGNGASRETADIMQGMLRHIMYVSDGDIAVDTAYEHMVKCSRGFLRVVTEYENDTSFNQCIRIKRVMDPIDTVFMDPSCQCPVGSDAEWGAIVTWLTADQYKREYPNSKLAEQDKAVWSAISNSTPEWAKDGEACSVVEYFVKEREEYEIADVEGQTVEVKSLQMPEGVDPAMWKQYLKGLRKRKAYRTKVMWYKVNAIEVLDSTEWPGKYIPIVPVYGNEHYVDGKLLHSGLTRSAKDPARNYNVYKASLTDSIARVPKTPIMAAEGSLVNKGAWRNAGRNPQAVLEYKAFDDRGNQLPPPTPYTFEPAIQAISVAMSGAEQDIKNVTGMYSPSMGVNESGQSGVAIRQLQRQGQVVNYHYIDNLSRSIRHLGRILIDLFPKIYDVPRVVRIVKPDQTEDLVTINAPTQDEKGIERVYDLSQGEYDVTVSVGPSYQTKRQEQLALLESLMQGPLGQLIAMKAPDLIAAMLDFEVAKDLQERLTPPEFAQGQQNIPPQLQQHLQQMQQALRQLQQENQQLRQGQEVKMQQIDLERRAREQQMEDEYNLKRKQIDADAELEIYKANKKAETDKDVAAIQAQADIIIASGKSSMELQGQIASTAVNNAMQTGAKDVEIEVGGEKDEGEYDNGVGNDAGMED